MQTKNRALRAMRIVTALTTLALLPGCGSDTTVNGVTLTLFSPTKVGLSGEFGAVEALRISAIDRTTGVRVAQEIIEPSADGGSDQVSNIPFGDDVQIYVEALNAAGVALASGGTPGFAVDADIKRAARFFVYLTQVGAIATLNAVWSGPSVKPSPMDPGGERAGHTATLLADGRVLIVGGAQLTAAAAGIAQTNIEGLAREVLIYSPATNYFDHANNDQGGKLSLSTARAYHTAAALNDGRIVIAGGLATSGTDIHATADVEIITPNADGTFSITSAPALNQARAHHAAAKRASGGVLLSGGLQFDPLGEPVYLESNEFMAPDNSTFFAIDDLPTARAYHTATAVGDTVVIAGGKNEQGALTNTTVFSQNASGSYLFGGLPGMTTPRYGHAAIRLSTDDGRYVLVMGGFTGDGQLTANYEIFDTTALKWVSVTNNSIATSRAHFELVELHNKELLVAGGLGVGQTAGTVASIDNVERLTPQTLGAIEYDVETLHTNLTLDRFDAASVVLDTGMVLITGGSRVESGGYKSIKLCDIYNPGPPRVVTEL